MYVEALNCLLQITFLHALKKIQDYKENQLYGKKLSKHLKQMFDVVTFTHALNNKIEQQVQ